MATKKSPETFSLISRRKLLALYTALVRCRMTADLAATPSRKSRVGHEAPAVAVVLDLKAGDTIAAPERDVFPALVNGTPPSTIFSSLRSRGTHPRASFAAMMNAAIAAARKHTQRKSRNVAAVFASGASVSSAAFRKALRTADAERLPILFVSQVQAGESAQPEASGHDFPAITVDGDDVVALYRVASEALTHARRGNGPTLIECIPWPLAVPHNGDVATTDSILNMERYLAQMGIPYERWKRKAIEEFGRGLRTVPRVRPIATGKRTKPGR